LNDKKINDEYPIKTVCIRCPIDEMRCELVEKCKGADVNCKCYNCNIHNPTCLVKRYGFDRK